MAYELKSVEREKLCVTIVDQILEGVRTGGFQSGVPLPPECVLGVRTGSGTYVSPDVLSKGARLRTHAAASSVPRLHDATGDVA